MFDEAGFQHLGDVFPGIPSILKLIRRTVLRPEPNLKSFLIVVEIFSQASFKDLASVENIITTEGFKGEKI